jgi:integrase
MSKSVPRWYPLLALLAFTGMRIGEATALRW